MVAVTTAQRFREVVLPLDLTELVTFLELALVQRKYMVVHFVNAYSIACFQKSETLFEMATREHSRFILDGVGGTLVAKVLKLERFTRIPGPDFTEYIMTNFLLDTRIALIGGSQISQFGFANALLTKFGRELDLAIEPPFTDWKHWNLKNYADALAAEKIDLVLVALGTPLQDEIAERMIELYPAMYFCVGAAIDFMSGNKPRAPRIVRKVGLEWLFRLATEPNRLWRRYTLSMVPYLKFLASIRSNLPF